ncbi:histidine phosphatase family protein [bacterium]|nr:histidine phosphatase family protein [bacterium]
MKQIPTKPFYYVRHGQTDANANGLTCGGDWDLPLNELGLSQASKLASKLLSFSPKIEEIRCSPMIRAKQTAETLNSLLKAPMSIVEGLREWRVGDWEKLPWENVPNPFNTTEDPSNGETREAFEERVTNTISNELKNTTKTLLFVSHGAFAHALFTYLGIEQSRIENCELYQVEPIDHKWTLVKI